MIATNCDNGKEDNNNNEDNNAGNNKIWYVLSPYTVEEMQARI